MILPAQTIHKLAVDGMISPYCERYSFQSGSLRLTGGLGPAGYDICLDQSAILDTNGFALASSLERFKMPADILGQVCDKSSWARTGLFVQNTIIEPGWEGWLTLELTNHGRGRVVEAGSPIAQIVFMRLEAPTDRPYGGKYQHQGRGPQEAR